MCRPGVAIPMPFCPRLSVEQNLETQETYSLSGANGEKVKLMNVDGWALDKYI